MSDDEDDEEPMPGIALPTFAAGPADDDDDDDGEESAPAVKVAEDEEEEEEEEEEESATGLLSADAAFADDTMDSLELDPFRRAAAAAQPDVEEPEDKGKGKGKSKAGWVAKGHVSQRKIFVGGLSFDTTDASLLKAAVKYGKVQEAVVVRTDGGKSRGFGFVTFVSHKGATYAIKEAGDPPQVAIDGRQCTVRYSDDKQRPTEGLHKLPARGHLPESRPAPRERTDKRELPERGGGGMDGALGVAAIAASHKRGGGGGAEEDEAEAGGERPKKARKKKEEIVTITRRQEAEKLDKRPITMKELFPKEFWRV